jgi:hypothetical protein
MNILTRAGTSIEDIHLLLQLPLKPANPNRRGAKLKAMQYRQSTRRSYNFVRTSHHSSSAVHRVSCTLGIFISIPCPILVLQPLCL